MKKSLLVAIMVILAITAVFANGNKESGEAQKVIKLCQFKVEIADDIKELAKEYEELTGVKVEVESTSGTDYQTLLRTKFAGNEAPDIFNNEGYSQLQDWVEHLEDLSNETWVKDMSSSTVSGATVDGKIYGLPLYLEGYGMCYNKDIFKEAGITQLPKTLDEFETICEKLESAGFSAVGLPFGGSYNPGRFMFNVAIAHQENPSQFIKDATLGKVDFVNNEIMQDWVDYLDVCLSHCLGNPLELDFSGQISTFALGEAAMSMVNNGAWISLRSINPEINLGFMNVPINNDPEFNDCLYAGPSTYWVINKDSPVKEEAKDFLEWLVTSDRGQYYLTEVFGFVPGLTTMKVDESIVGPLSAEISEAVANNKALGWEWPKYPNGAADAIGDAILKYAAKKLDRTQFLQEVQDIFVRLSQVK